MKRIVCLVAVAAAGLAQAGGAALPGGAFSGTAEWRGPKGSTGTYTVERTFEGNTMRSKFTWDEGKPRNEEHVLTFSLGTEPTFEVTDPAGQVVGKGHCFDDTCAYRADFGKVSVEETFRWTSDTLTVLGSKSGPGFSVVWKESLRSR
jgi:hypothetical protein